MDRSRHSKWWPDYKNKRKTENQSFLWAFQPTQILAELNLSFYQRPVRSCPGHPTVSIGYLVEHHQLGPGPLDVVGVEVSVQLEVHVSHLALKIFEDCEDFFLFSQPWWNFFYSKSIWIFSQALHFDKCIGEVTVLRIVVIFLIKIYFFFSWN